MARRVFGKASRRRDWPDQLHERKSKTRRGDREIEIAAHEERDGIRCCGEKERKRLCFATDDALFLPTPRSHAVDRPAARRRMLFHAQFLWSSIDRIVCIRNSIP